MIVQSYGYQTNTRIKFVLIISLAGTVVRDAEVKTVSPSSLAAQPGASNLIRLQQIFRAIHNSYIAYISNPFTGSETDNPAALMAPIRSPLFMRRMDAIATPVPLTG